MVNLINIKNVSLKSQIESKAYSNKNELINDSVRQARKQQRQVDWISAILEKAEKSGFTDDSKEEILLQSKLNNH